jgi:hypothetical protein
LQKKSQRSLKNQLAFILIHKQWLLNNLWINPQDQVQHMPIDLLNIKASLMQSALIMVVQDLVDKCF